MEKFIKMKSPIFIVTKINKKTTAFGLEFFKVGTIFQLSMDIKTNKGASGGSLYQSYFDLYVLYNTAKPMFFGNVSNHVIEFYTTLSPNTINKYIGGCFEMEEYENQDVFNGFEYIPFYS